MDRVNVRVVDNELQLEEIRIAGFSQGFPIILKDGTILKMPYEIKALFTVRYTNRQITALTFFAINKY